MKYSIAAFANIVNVSKPAVRNAISNKRIKVTKNPKTGYIEIDSSQIEVFKKNSPKWNKNSIYNNLEDKYKEEPTPEKKTTKDVEKNGIESIFDAKQVKEKYEALQKKLSYEKELGTLINAEEVKVKWVDTAIKLQKSMLAIPSRVSSMLAAETDEFMIKKILTDEIKASLTLVANDIGNSENNN